MKNDKPQNHVVLVLDDSAHMKGHQRDVCDGLNAFVDRLKGDTQVHLYTFGGGETFTVFRETTAREWLPLLKEDLKTEGHCPLHAAMGLALIAFAFNNDPNNVKPSKGVIVFDVGGKAAKTDDKKLQKKNEKYVKNLLEEKNAAGWGLYFLGSGVDLVSAHETTQQAEGLSIERHGVVHANRTKAYKKIAKMAKNFFKHGTFYSLA